MKLRRLHLVLWGLNLLISAACAQVTTTTTTEATVPDERVVKALAAAKIGYSIDAGDFRLDYKVDETRSQRVWVASETSRLGALELRDVWSVAARGNGRPPADLALRLLSENVRMVLGAWQVNQGEDEYLIVFSSPLNADADPDTLREVVEAVTFSADRIEKQLSDSDAF